VEDLQSYSYVIETEPKPKKRPKVYRWSTVNPSAEDEKKVAVLFAKLENKPSVPLNGQVRAGFKFYKSPPKATPKWKLPLMEKGVLRPNKSPDLDNYVKLILDSLNGLLWEDDRFIVETHASKFYTTGHPRTEIYVDELPTPNRKNANVIFDEYGKNQSVNEFF